MTGAPGGFRLSRSLRRAAIVALPAGAAVLAGCADYAITVQGVPLDRWSEAVSPVVADGGSGREAARRNDRGVLLEREGDLEGALRQYRLALESDPAFVTAWINAGNAYLKLANPAEAGRCYQRALELDPDNPRALNNLACVQLGRKDAPAVAPGRIPEAIALLERAIAADPDRRYLYLDSLGWALYLDGKTAEALAVLSEALEKTPSGDDYLLAETHFHLGVVRKDRGERAEAIAHFQESLKRAPGTERKREINALLQQLSDEK